MKPILTAVGLAALLATNGHATTASMPGAPVSVKQVSPGDLNNALQPLSDLTPQYKRVFVVKGDTRWDYSYLQVDELRFEPGARLIISKASQNLRPQSFLVAQRIVVVDQNNPGVITYERDTPRPVDIAIGEAPSGPSGAGDNQPGSHGNAGTKGIPGAAGLRAPSLTLVVMTVPTAGPVIDLQGGEGGSGAHGMKGGRGGNGAKGNPASQSFFDCKRGAGTGGAAGAGGVGGQGGEGGVGGDGGVVLLVSKADNLPSLTQKFRVKVGGGQGGTGGEGGLGGDAGSPGPGGQEASPYCRGNGSSGQAAGSGVRGVSGQRGVAGREGDFTVGAMTFEQYERYIWPESDQVSWLDRASRYLKKLTY